MENLYGGANDRRYQDLAHKVILELAAGKYPVGSRLPTERQLAQRFAVSRPTVRNAVIALEVLGLVEVRVGSGTFVLRLPGQRESHGSNVTAFELVEAQLLLEGEAAALAATQIDDSQLRALETLLNEIHGGGHDSRRMEKADRAFHLAIANATGNKVVFDAVERLWLLLSISPEAISLREIGPIGRAKTMIIEHTEVFEALRNRNPTAARAAMQTHLSSALDSLLLVAEKRAVEEARRSMAAQRTRYNRISRRTPQLG